MKDNGLIKDIFGRGDGDPDVHGYPGEKRYVGDKPQVAHISDPIADWVGHPANQWELGDSMADGSDDQPYEED